MMWQWGHSKWFGSEDYGVDRNIVLTAGRATPALGEAILRGEGVALVLRGLAVNTWKHGGRQWKAWSSRCVSPYLQVSEGAMGRLHVVSCYAPTTAASREDKEAFFQELDNIISLVPSNEKHFLLGDFSAHVGSRESENEQWRCVRGPTGME